MLAHILFTAVNPLLLLVWGVTAAGILIGLVLVMADLHRRRLGAALLTSSIAVAVVVSAAIPWPPTRPGYSISIAEPQPGVVLSSRFTVTVRGQHPDGSSAEVPGGDQVVYVALDGRQVALARAASVSVQALPGAHRLRVEILAADHREFTPPISVDLPIVVRVEAAPS